MQSTPQAAAPTSRRPSGRFASLLTSLPGRSGRRLAHSTSANPLTGTPRSLAVTSPSSTAGGTDHSTFVDSPGPEGSRTEEVSYPDEFLAAPTVPYAAARTDRADSSISSRRSSLSSSRPGQEDDGSSTTREKGKAKPRPISLSVNYVPAKFTRLHQPGEWGHRLRRKAGGGRSAFSDDASRMGMPGLVDDDEGIEYKMGRGGVKRKGKRVLRWNRFKWILFVANTVLMIYGLATLIAAILVWLNVFYQSDVIRVGNKDELIVSTVASALCTLTALLGYSGIILNNRAFLAVYTFLLWIDLAFIAAPGYMTYKQTTFNLEGKLNQQWSRTLRGPDRLRIQDALTCCGYYSPYIEAAQSPLCYARSNLPGCKARYLHLERRVLTTWYTTAFSLAPAQIVIIVAALLCSNHITYRFGKGLTPKRYRLDMRSMEVILDDVANKIAAEYGDDAAQNALSRSVSRMSTEQPARPSSANDFLAPDGSRRNSFAGVGSLQVGPDLARTPSRTQDGNGSMSTTSTGWNSQAQSAAPDLSAAPANRPVSGQALYNPRRDSVDGDQARSRPTSVQLVMPRPASQASNHAPTPVVAPAPPPAPGPADAGFNFGVPSPRIGDDEQDRYEDAAEGEELDRMEVSTGYGTEAGSVENRRSAPRNRFSVGWAQ